MKREKIYDMSQTTIATTFAPGRKRSRKGRAPTRVSGGVGAIPLAIRTRGTPAGYYEITRTVNFYVKIILGQFADDTGTTLTEGIGLSFSSQAVRVYQNNGATKVTPVPNYAELAALFDEVKLSKVELGFGLGLGTVASTSVAYNPLQIVYGSDENDMASSLAICQQLGDSKTWYGSSSDNSNMRMVCRPKYQRIIYYTSLLSGYEPTQGYVRSDYDIEHYGVKMAVVIPPGAPASVAASGNMAVSCKFTMRCKSLK